MQDAESAQRLAGAAAQLCLAYEELVAAGYDAWSLEIKVLTEIIDAEIDWLRDSDSVTHATGA